MLFGRWDVNDADGFVLTILICYLCRSETHDHDARPWAYRPHSYAKNLKYVEVPETRIFVGLGDVASGFRKTIMDFDGFAD